MAKKRKQTPQSVTLHNFFSKCDATSLGNKKPKLNKESAKPTKAKKISFNVSPEDIIVIDDDDDEPARQPVEVSSDIEIVEEPPIGEPSASNSAGSHRRGTEARSNNIAGRQTRDDSVFSLRTRSCRAEESLFGKPSLLLDVPDASREDSFGVPLLLLPNAPVAPEHYESQHSHVYEQSVGSTQTGLSSSTLSAGAFDIHPSCPAPVAFRSKTTSAESDIDEDPVEHEARKLLDDDEWGTGDDEVEDNIDVKFTVIEDDDIENESQSCPICGTLLQAMDALEIQKHVNLCVDLASDAPSARTDVPGSSSLKPLSLSAIQESAVQTITPMPSSDFTTNVGSGPKDAGAFSVLMTSYKENEAWKEATIAEDRNFRPTKANGGRRKAPFYKVLQGMPIAVDAFRYGTIPGVNAYFLTHAHSDHYTNLSANWKSGPIYCSQGTANLIMHMLGVDSKWVHPFPMDVATEIPNTGGVHVTLIEANHCPGSCLFLFEGKQTVNAGDSAYKSAFVGSSKVFRYLHCGDFRASPQHVLHPAVKGKRIDHVYLDTTYLDPKYCFPPQSQVISACAELARRIVDGGSLHGGSDGDDRKNGRVDGWFKVLEKPKENEPQEGKSGRTLVVVGTYSIGKERIVKAIARALQTKVYSDTRKTAILRCQSDPELDMLLTTNPLDAGVHLLPLGTISSDRLKIYIERFNGHFNKVVGFRPTGWTYTQPSGSETLPSISSVISRSQNRSFTHANLNPMKNSSSTLLLYGVPYSEHSSFFELTCFALSLEWGRMIATVNVGSESSRGKMAKWVEKWEAEKKKRGKTEVVQFRAADYW